MNKKGQALVEFILIIPFVLMILIGVFDYVKITDAKYELSNNIEEYLLSSKEDKPNNIKVIKKDNNTEYKASKDVEISSAFLVPIIGKNYTVEVSRVINE